MKYPTWQTLKSEIVYQNPWIKIHQDQVLRPDGKPGIYGYLEKPTSVFILPQTADGSIIFLRQYRYPIKKYLLEIPSGVVNSQNLLQNAKRELFEETGLKAKKWHRLGHFFIAAGHESTDVVAFLASDVNESELSSGFQEGDEAISHIIKISPKKLSDYIRTGKIECGITLSVLGIYLSSPFLRF